MEAEAFPCETRKFRGVHALLFTFFRVYGIMRLQRTNPIEEEASMTYRIFLVEDDHSIASGLQHQLEQWDFEVQVVQNFRGVLTECTAFDPHLILMDIMLPCYDGYHWCREIRRVSEVPIIFLSSASDNLNLIMAVNMGGDDFIAKPFDWNVLLAKIQALLRRTYDFGGQAAQIGRAHV